MNVITGQKYNYAEAACQALKQKKIKFTESKTKEGKKFSISYPCKNVARLKVLLYVDEDGNCRIRSYLPFGIESEQNSRIHYVLNKVNSKYRFVSFYLDEDNDVCAGYDVLLSVNEENLPEYLLTLLVIYSDIVDESVPEIKAALAETVQEPEEEEFIRINLFEED